jgi:hypothetical protein
MYEWMCSILRPTQNLSLAIMEWKSILYTLTNSRSACHYVLWMDARQFFCASFIILGRFQSESRSPNGRLRRVGVPTCTKFLLKFCWTKEVNCSHTQANKRYEFSRNAPSVHWLAISQSFFPQVTGVATMISPPVDIQVEEESGDLRVVI